MNDSVKKTFNYLSKEPGTWNPSNGVNKILEFEDMFVLTVTRKSDDLGDCYWMTILKEDGSYDISEFYSDIFKRPIIKEYSFEEFERLCS